jgi:hypothetical protein
MIENDIVSVPIRIKLIDTSRIDAQDTSEYPQAIIKPSPTHYPHLVDSAMDSYKEPLYTSISDKEMIRSPTADTTSCFLIEIFSCCK